LSTYTVAGRIGQALVQREECGERQCAGQQEAAEASQLRRRVRTAPGREAQRLAEVAQRAPLHAAHGSTSAKLSTRRCPWQAVAGARCAIVLAAVEQHRVHAGLARGVELLPPRRTGTASADGSSRQLAGDGAVTGRVALAADRRVEPAGEQRRRSPAPVWPNSSFCAGTEPDEYTYSGWPSACQRRSAATGVRIDVGA
jgi:hypothetical protein